MKNKVITLMLTAALFACSEAVAGMSTMRCGDSLAVVGETHITVKNNCGKPCLDEKCGKKGSGCRRMYYCINGYMNILNFDDGKLADIESTHEKCQDCDEAVPKKKKAK
jgi:hypothetical protein